MARTKHFGGGGGRGGSSYRGGQFQHRNNPLRTSILYLGFDRRGAGGNNRGNGRNGSSYSNNNDSNPRPSRFSNKRSRSRSPVRQSRFDNDSNDNKRPRTDHSRSSHVSLNSIHFLFDRHLNFRMNRLDIPILHQQMVMVCILNDHSTNLNLMECQHHLRRRPLQVIPIVDSIIKRAHIHRLIKCMVNHLNNHHFHPVHHHPRKILCFVLLIQLFYNETQRTFTSFSSLNTPRLFSFLIGSLFLSFSFILYHTSIACCFSCSFAF